MATADEVLKEMDNVSETNNDSPVCVIDPETRTITVPPEYQLLGVESDEKVERLYFQCPKIVGDNVDLSQLILFINYQNAGQEIDAYKITDVETDGDNITFSWLLDRKVTAYRTTQQNKLGFSFCAQKADEDGTLTQEWNTTVNTECSVLEGLEAQEHIEEENSAAIAQIWQAIDELKAGGGGSGTPGKDGVGIDRIEKTGTQGLVDTYTIYLTDESTYTFTVRNGKNGDPGAKGDTGTTPNIQIGEVQTLEPGQQATASITGTPENPVLNLGIPKGEKGDPGEDAESGGSYTLPIMSDTQLGGGKAVAKTSEDVPVAVDEEGKLWVQSQDGGGTNEKNYAASVSELLKVGVNQYVAEYHSLMFVPSADGKLKVGGDNLIGDPYSGKVNTILEPTLNYVQIQDGYSLDWNGEYTGTKNWQSTRFGFSVNLESDKTYTLSLKTNKNSTVYLYGVNGDETGGGSLIATISNVNGTGEITFIVSSDYNRLRVACAEIPIELTEVTLVEGEEGLVYGGGSTVYDVTKDIPIYISNVYGLNCVGNGEFYASPFAIISLNGIYSNGKAKTYATDKYYVNMGDSIWTFGSNTGGIGNLSDYMIELCGGTWINIATGGTTMANRPGEQAGEYDALDFHALADCIYSGDFSSAKNSGLTTNLDANVDSIVWDDVDYITVAYGTNDLAFGAKLDNSEDLYDKSTVCGALRYGIEKVNSKYPNIKFKVCGILYRFADGISVSDIVEWNDGIKKACISVGAEYIDMSCGINKGNYSKFLYDGTHPNANGKEAIAKTLAKTIINI